MKTPLSGALLACLVFGATAPAQAEPQDLMNKAGCLACHHKEKKLVGPALSTVAARYKGQGPDVATALSAVGAGQVSPATSDAASSSGPEIASW